MKRKFIWLVGLLAVLLVVGCSNPSDDDDGGDGGDLGGGGGGSVTLTVNVTTDSSLGGKDIQITVTGSGSYTEFTNLDTSGSCTKQFTVSPGSVTIEVKINANGNTVFFDTGDIKATKTETISTNKTVNFVATDFSPIP